MAISPFRTRRGPAGYKTLDEFAESFWARVSVGGSDDCWDWLAGRSPKGYGQASWPVALVRSGAVPRLGAGAHRVAYILSGADPFDERMVLHSCDNPPCCNPAHLRYGTAKENAEERDTRGRLVVGYKHRGADHPQAKLTEAQVVEIRARRRSGEKLAPLAGEYGVAIATVSAIVNRRIWEHVA